MCGCKKNTEPLPRNAVEAIAELKSQRKAYVEAAAQGDQTVGASIQFIDNILGMYSHDCECKSER